MLEGLPDDWRTWSDEKKRKLYDKLKYDSFSITARAKQLPPEDNSWHTWLYLAGRGVGKTRSACEFIKKKALAIPNCRIALIGQTYQAAREVALDGESGLIAITHPMYIEKYSLARGLVTFKNGSQLFTYSGADPEKLRGPQFHYAVLDELAAWQYQDDTYDNLMMALRLGAYPQKFISTTPKPTELVLRLIKQATTDEGIRIVQESTYDNAANLPESQLKQLRDQYEGTDIGRQELHGEILEEVAGALWKRATIALYRANANPTERFKAVIGVDPAATSGDKSDETGIIVAVRGDKGKIYVVEDLSMKGDPNAWAKKVVEAYYRWNCDAVVVETNNGGDAWKTIIHNADRRVNVKSTWSKANKKERAVPVAHLYQRGQVSHVGTHAMLEAQMTTWDPVNASKSPDRIDALVFAILELDKSGGGGQLFQASGRIPRF